MSETHSIAHEIRRQLVEISLKVIAYDYKLINLDEGERRLIAQYPSFFNHADLKSSSVRVLRDAILRDGAFAEQPVEPKSSLLKSLDC